MTRAERASLTPSMPMTTAKPSRASGFTIIEVLVVVSILALLAGILIVGIRAVSRGAREKATIATLENARSMVAEYELTSKLPKVVTPPNAASFTNAGFPAYYATAFAAPRRVTDDTESVPATDRRQAPAMIATGQFFKRLRAVPKNESSFANFKADDLLVVSTDPTNATAAKYQVPLDAWGNPILAVFQSVTGVYEMANGTDPINLDGTIRAAGYDRPNQTKTAPDGKPFFVSAGPDGDLSTGDDNVYSFQVN